MQRRWPNERQARKPHVLLSRRTLRSAPDNTHIRNSRVPVLFRAGIPRNCLFSKIKAKSPNKLGETGRQGCPAGNGAKGGGKI